MMKVSAGSSRTQILQLLREEVPIYDKVWTWLLKNTQKINPKLYNLRKTEYK